MFVKVGDLYLNLRQITTIRAVADGDVWITTTAAAWDGGTRAEEHLISGPDAAALLTWRDVYAGVADVLTWFVDYAALRVQAEA